MKRLFFVVFANFVLASCGSSNDCPTGQSRQNGSCVDSLVDAGMKVVDSGPSIISVKPKLKDANADGAATVDCSSECVLFPDTGVKDSRFGQVIATVEDGKWLAVAANAEVFAGRGAAYLFERLDNGYYEQRSRVAPAELVDNDYFATSLALHKDYLAAPSPFKNGLKGAVFMYSHDGKGNLTLMEKITRPMGSDNDRFGISVAWSGDDLIIGSIGENNIGAVYVYGLQNGVWTEKQRLVPPNLKSFNVFGSTLAADDNRFIVGSILDNSSKGAAYIYERNSGGSFFESARLIANDGATSDLFGWLVAIDGDRALVTASSDDDNGTDTGSVYVFEKGNGWEQKDKLLALPTDEGKFGMAIALKGDEMLIGSQTDIGNNPKPGFVHEFIRNSSGTWTRAERFFRKTQGDGYGDSVHILDDTYLIGARWDSLNGEKEGAVYLLRKP